MITNTTYMLLKRNVTASLGHSYDFRFQSIPGKPEINAIKIPVAPFSEKPPNHLWTFSFVSFDLFWFVPPAVFVSSV